MTVYDSSRHKQLSDCLKPNPALGNSFEYVFCEIAALFVQGEMGLFHGPRPFGWDRLAQDSAVCCAWTTMEQSIHYRTDSTLVGHYVDQSWYTPTERLRHRMVADALVSNRHQAIGNNHADVIMFILRVKGFILHPLNKVRERSATRKFLCYYRVWPPTTIMCYVMFITCQWKLGKI